MRGGGRLRAGEFPTPDEAIFGIEVFADVMEAALGEHAGRGVFLGQSVGAHEAEACVSERVLRESGGGFYGVTFSLMFGSDGVGDLDCAFRVRWAFEAATADPLGGLAMRDGEAIDPRRRRVGGIEEGEPGGGELLAIFGGHLCDAVAGFGSGREAKQQSFGLGGVLQAGRW